MSTFPALRATALAALLAAPALAHHAGDVFEAGEIQVSHAWTVATGQTAHAIEVFLTIDNRGAEPDRLIGATTRFSAPAVFQAPIVGGDGTLSVTEVPAIEIAPGQQVTFQPGGIRIVLGNVQRHFAEGDHFHMILEFEKAGEIEIDVDVEAQDHDHEHQPAS